MKFIIVIVIMAFCLSSCEIQSTNESRVLKIKKSKLRRELFLECMKAAETQNNGVNSTVESEVSTTVDSCRLYAYYLMNQRY